MIWNLTPREKAKVYLALADALNIPDEPTTQRDRSRAEFVEAITGGYDVAELWATLAIADDINLCTDGYFNVTALAVAEAYSCDIGRARYALRLAGWIRLPGDLWENHGGAYDHKNWVPEPCDMLSEQFE